MSYIEDARKVFDLEIEGLVKTKEALDKTFDEFVEAFSECEGKVVTTGVGKSGHIARKISSTLSSLGTPSFFISPTDALHGDLGMVSETDVVLLVSNSGETDEILVLLPILKKIGTKITAITGDGQSTLAREADIVEVLPKFREASLYGLAPTSSSTVMLCFGDAVAVAISKKINFKKEDFKSIHPLGALGK